MPILRRSVVQFCSAPLVRFHTALDTHSKGDDDRPPEVLQEAWERDWLAKRLKHSDPVATGETEKAQKELRSVITALEDEPSGQLDPAGAFALPDPPLVASSQELLCRPGASQTRINQLLCDALDGLLAANADLLVMGEDLADPYGGAFKVTSGLSTKHPDKIFSTPVSEAALVGFGSGVSLNGGRAIVEIMFGDFVMLAADQIVNQAAKMHFMYDGKVGVPLTVRLVSGGYRGYGPTHSQSLESLFCGVPGLKVVALSRRHDPGALLEAAVSDPNPVLFVENKILYALTPHAQPPAGFRFVPVPPDDAGDYPALVYRTPDEGETADVTVVTYGGLTGMVEDAMEALVLEEELDFDYIVLTGLSPLSIAPVLDSVRESGRLVVVEEGTEPWGIGSEIIARVAEELNHRPFACARVAALNVPIPSARELESEVLPSVDRVREALAKVAGMDNQ